jgi:hypothetical protein
MAKENFLRKGISTSKGFLIITVFALLVVGILAWQRAELEKIKLPELPKEKKERKEADTGDWRIYRNEILGLK